MGDSAATLEALSLEETVGQLLHVGIGLGNFETPAGWPDEEMRTVLEELQPGAVRVYGNHAATPHFMAQYTNQLQRWAEATTHGIPLLVSCDCEYGTVDIVAHEARAYPSLMGRTATGDIELASETSAAIARDMLGMGLNMNHQPVVDVNTNPDNPVIGVRSPGSDPETVSTYAAAALDGIHAEDQIAVAKHFPGHGDTELDSHMDLPHVTYDRETLERVHLPPFETMIERGVDCIMTSHIVVDCLDPALPATLSPTILTDLLRDELDFDGVVVTDAMMMDAIADNFDVGEAAVRAVNAGADLVLTGFVPAADLFATRDAIVEAVRTGDLSRARVDEAAERVLRLKNSYGLADRRFADPLAAVETITSEEHESIARRGYERSFTVRDPPEILPLDADSTVLLTGIRGVHALEPHFDASFGDVVACSLAPSELRTLDDPKPAMDPESPRQSLETLRSVTDAVDVAVVTTYAREAFAETQRRIVEGLSSHLPVVVVSLGLPNEREHLPDDVAYVATYAQDRLGLPQPFPDTAGEALVTLIAGESD